MFSDLKIILRISSVIEVNMDPSLIRFGCRVDQVCSSDQNLLVTYTEVPLGDVSSEQYLQESF